MLLQQVSVLETMSPLDFLEFRDVLYPASGFQSVQFRLVENKLGLPAEARLTYGQRGYCTYLQDNDSSVVKASEAEPSLFKLIESWLERTPFLAIGGFSWWAHYQAAVTAMLDQDEHAIKANEGKHITSAQMELQLAELKAQRDSFACLFDEEKYNGMLRRGDRRLSWRATQAALLINLYGDEPLLQLPSRLLSLLADIDEHFTAWRHRHALMVHRMLGVRMGTGGSSGYAYLRATADRHKIFSDITTLSTFLLPRYALPPLPEAIRATLSFSISTAISTANGLAVPAVVTASADAPAPPAAAAVDAAAPRCPFGHTA